MNDAIKWLSKNENMDFDYLDPYAELKGDSLYWTTKISDFVELVFALQEAKVFNKGKIHTKTLIATLCKMFNLKMSDCFAHYISIRNRSKRTKFLNKLVHLLENKMDKDEEEIHNRYK